MNKTIMLLTYTSTWDIRRCTHMFSPIYSPITYLMIESAVPRGFINELFNLTAPKPETFEKVSSIYLHLLNFLYLFKL